MGVWSEAGRILAVGLGIEGRSGGSGDRSELGVENCERNQDPGEVCGRGRGSVEPKGEAAQSHGVDPVFKGDLGARSRWDRRF
ncbi:hypothetical protein KFK09_002400 [Dendrobium nobile]|uniref:Uncharacterized protein n=1 Tax=Dendrobium nobile TaxID=94219 RepID=A0A8T3C3R1_DENNO|nr:hypothetical protein KFK09_002400 [Dendrobium nobile]